MTWKLIFELRCAEELWKWRMWKWFKTCLGNKCRQTLTHVHKATFHWRAKPIKHANILLFSSIFVIILVQEHILKTWSLESMHVCLAPARSLRNYAQHGRTDRWHFSNQEKKTVISSVSILTALRRTIDHVEFVYLLGVILCLRAFLTATLLPIPPELLQ